MLWILSHTRHIKMDKLTGNTWTRNSYLYFQFFNVVRKCNIYIAYLFCLSGCCICISRLSLLSSAQAAQAASAWPEDPCFTLVTTRPAWGAGCEHLNHPTMQYYAMLLKAKLKTSAFEHLALSTFIQRNSIRGKKQWNPAKQRWVIRYLINLLMYDNTVIFYAITVSLVVCVYGGGILIIQQLPGSDPRSEPCR